MRALLRLIVVVTGMALLVFAVRDMVSLGMGLSSSVSHAPRDLWDALGDAVTWGIEYKVGATVAFIVCLAVLYVRKVPTVRSK
jgi:uncharacterized membrane protein YczE